jgi:hypothetical protein
MQPDLYFSWSANRPCPYLREVVEYVNDGSAGHIVFNGYWYLRPDDHPLPRPIEFTTKLVTKEPYETGIDPSGNRFERYRIENCRTYRAVATAHTEIQDTSEYWHDEEEGGDICLFPTALQRIDFRVTELVSVVPSDIRTITYRTMWLPPALGTDSTAISANDVDDVLVD